MINGQEMRLAISRKLNLPLSDSEWKYLDSQGLLRDVYCGRLTLDALVEKVSQMRSAFGTAPPNPRHRPSSIPHSDRMQALAVVLGEKIREFSRPFVEQLLGGKYIAEDEISKWLESHACTSEQSLLGVFQIRQDKCGSFQPVGPCFQIRNLTLVGPDGKRYLVRPGSELDELRRRVEAVEELFGVPAPEAVRSILAGLPPRIDPIVISAKYKYIPAASRFLLEVDPALTPKEVAHAYADFRSQVLKGRARRLSQKHLELVKFMCSRPIGEKGREAMTVWNRKFKQWKYTQVTNFLRDAATAKKRLVQPGNLGIEGGAE